MATSQEKAAATREITDEQAYLTEMKECMASQPTRVAERGLFYHHGEIVSVYAVERQQDRVDMLNRKRKLMDN